MNSYLKSAYHTYYAILFLSFCFTFIDLIFKHDNFGFLIGSFFLGIGLLLFGIIQLIQYLKKEEV